MTKALISELRGVIAAHDDDPAERRKAKNRKAQNKFRDERRARILAAWGLTPEQIIRGIDGGVVRLEIDPAYLIKCRENQEKAKRGEQ